MAGAPLDGKIMRAGDATTMAANLVAALWERLLEGVDLSDGRHAQLVLTGPTAVLGDDDTETSREFEAWERLSAESDPTYRPAQRRDVSPPDEGLTERVATDLITAAIVDYRTCREEQGMTHREALDQVQSEVAESVACLRGECGH